MAGSQVTQQIGANDPVLVHARNSSGVRLEGGRRLLSVLPRFQPERSPGLATAGRDSMWFMTVGDLGPTL